MALPGLPSITQLFNMAIGEYGQDYAVPVGTPIYSPVAGIVGTEDNGKKAWGKRLIVNASSGLSFAAGHLTSFAVQAGQKVKAGQLIGYSGGAPSDPSSGVSTGPHIETQFFQMTAKGLQYINPKTVFASNPAWENSIFNIGGSATSTYSLQSAQGGSSSSSDATDISFPGGSIHIPNPFAAVGDVLTSTQKLATRAFFVGLGFSLFVIGLVLIFFGDIEKLIEAGKNTAETAGKVAATVAAPEVAVPAEAAEKVA